MYWPKANEPQKAIGGGKARYAPKGFKEDELGEEGELLVYSDFLACGDVPKATVKNEELETDYPLLSIGCACK